MPCASLNFPLKENQQLKKARKKNPDPDPEKNIRLRNTSLVFSHGKTGKICPAVILPPGHGFYYKMVAHFTMRIDGVNQAFRFVEGIWLW